jgi:hypothetical protein
MDGSFLPHAMVAQFEAFPGTRSVEGTIGLPSCAISTLFIAREKNVNSRADPLEGSWIGKNLLD